MKYMNALAIGFGVAIAMSFIMANLLPDILWGINAGMFAGIGACVAYLYYKDWRQQERIEDMVNDNIG